MRLIDADKAKEKLRGNAQNDGSPFAGVIVEVFCEFLDQAPTVEDAEEHDEHYARTYKDDFIRNFPDCPKFKNGTPTACRDSIYPTTESGCKTGNCDICWMAVMPETDANIDDTADRCVCCGDVIPEGRQVCPKCEGGGK
jgi:hypothetical protein